MQSPYQYKDRYPGLTPFAKDQSAIFFGRDKEKTDLFYQISLEKMVVLFGNSGLGKSSLMNAGVSPMLEANGYLPIRIRLNPYVNLQGKDAGENLLLRDFKLAFQFFKWQDNIIYNKENPQLWEYIKATPFGQLVTEEQNPVLYKLLAEKRNQRNKPAETITVPDKMDEASGVFYKLLQEQNSRLQEEQNKRGNEPNGDDLIDQEAIVTPVFIFDQFEEFFNHPITHQQEFLKQLSEVVHDETPYRILEWITSIDPDERTDSQIKWHHQPKVKFVFALRSDRLALMQSVTTFISTILRNRYELKPLTEVQAKKAIEEPGKIALPDDYTPTFIYEPETLHAIVAELSSGTNEIESSQLQIVCNAIEQRVKKLSKEQASGQVLAITKEIINPEKDIPKIFDSFYETQLENIADEADRKKIRLLIEDYMVVGNSRDSISENKLKLFNIDARLIKEMMDTRLVRWENTSRGPVYELTHDSLLDTVIKSKERRLKEEQKALQEAERIKNTEEAKMRNEELKEQYRRLALEMQLREEAETQKAEVERLSKRLKRNSRIIFFLTTALLVAGIVMAVIYARNREFEKNVALENLKSTQGQLDTANKKLVLVENQKKVVESIKGPALKTDAAKGKLVEAIYKVDSLSAITGQKDQNIKKVLDSVFKEELDSVYKEENKGQNLNWKKLPEKEKINKLKEVYMEKGYKFEREQSMKVQSSSLSKDAVPLKKVVPAIDKVP